MRPLFRRLFPLLALALVACDNVETPTFSQPEPGEALSGGSTTVMKFDQNAYSMPSANLAPMRRLDFSVGNSFFRNPWVIAPASTTARDGLGPLLNTNACQNRNARNCATIARNQRPKTISATNACKRPVFCAAQAA